MLTVYGIKQCDTCRKALKWLSGQGIVAVGFNPKPLAGLVL